jgi:hypothetical protein
MAQYVVCDSTTGEFLFDPFDISVVGYATDWDPA